MAGTALTSFVDGFIQRQPVWYRGVQIGYADFLKDGFDHGRALMCGGTLQTFTGVDRGDPKLWYTYDAWGRMISVTQYCLNHQIIPAWVSASQVKQDQQGRLTLPGGVPGGYQDGVTSKIPMPALLIGGAVALLLVMRR